MVKDTRSSVRARNEDNNNPKGKQNGDKATTRAGSTTPDTSALRRSARETSLKKKIDATPSKSRKSERLDKQPPSTPRDKKKHGTIEKQNELNPLRRSERGKKQSSSTSSGSRSKKSDKSSSTSSGSVFKKSDKSSGSPNMKGKRETKEKSIEQLTFETKEAGKSPKQDKVSKNAKSKRMDARAYRALFREKLKKANSSDGECKLISLKRKRSTVDLDSNASVRKESENTCSSPAGAVQSLLSPCRQSDQIETCGRCLKRQRVDNNSSKDFCSCADIDQQNGKTSIDMCCNHPYIVEPSMGHVITKGHPEVEYLDIGIKASGKLQLLDAMLKEMRNKGSRVLILFQSISGSGRDTIGDILDDFLRQRFGIDSYERIDGGLIYSKNQAALNKFNTREACSNF